MTVSSPAKQRAALLATAALLIAPHTVHAQDAQAADAGNGGIENITVTARLREENLQMVPIAMSVVQGDRLDNTGTVNTQSLANLVPALYYNSANPRNTAYTIRGLGSNTLSVSAANDGIESGVGFYVDGVYHARPATAAFDFTDIQSIEILRGPQGTLFGKNTADGAITITSRAPTFAPEAIGEVSYGDHQFMQAKASYSAGLTAHSKSGDDSL